MKKTLEQTIRESFNMNESLSDDKILKILQKTRKTFKKNKLKTTDDVKKFADKKGWIWSISKYNEQMLVKKDNIVVLIRLQDPMTNDDLPDISDMQEFTYRIIDERIIYILDYYGKKAEKDEIYGGYDRWIDGTKESDFEDNHNMYNR